MAKLKGEVLSTKDIAVALSERLAGTLQSVSITEATEIVKNVLKTILDEISREEVSGIMFKNYFSLNKYVRSGRSGKINGHTYNTDDKIYLKLSESKVLSEKLN